MPSEPNVTSMYQRYRTHDEDYSPLVISLVCEIFLDDFTESHEIFILCCDITKMKYSVSTKANKMWGKGRTNDLCSGNYITARM